MKLCSIAYVPPKNFGCAQVFWDNLKRFKTTYPIITYSEYPWPGVVPLKMDPTFLKSAKFPDGNPNPFAINNALFFTGLYLAMEQGYSHALYLESDCRVGCDDWDGKMFDEYFSAGKPALAGGTLVCYNPVSYNTKARLRWEELVGRNHRKNVPTPTYGWVPGDKRHVSSVFPNGALAIYDLLAMDRLFDIRNMRAAGRLSELATGNTAFDKRLGELLWEQFAEDAYEVLVPLSVSYSGYGEVVSTEQERLQWLREGKHCAIHQCKSQESV